MERSRKKTKLRIFLLFLVTVLTLGGVFMILACASTNGSPTGVRQPRLEKSPNFKRGRFVNRLPAKQPPFFETLGEWMKGSQHTSPGKGEVPVVNRTKTDFAELPSSGLRITWLGHSTTLVEIDGIRILFDPIWSERSSPFSFAGPKRFFAPPLGLEELPEIDAVLISHDHFDHLDKATIEQLAPRISRFIAPLGVAARLASFGVDQTKIVELDWWDATQVEHLRVVATPARHFSGRSLVMADRNQTLWAGFALVGPDHRVYYSGDTGMFPGFEEIGQQLGPFDAALIEVGAYNKLWADLHLGPEQAMKAAELVRAQLLIPVHYATFDLAMHSWTEPAERLLVASQNSRVPLTLPIPGESVERKHPPRLSRWWPDLPWQSREEHPIVSSGLSQTSPKGHPSAAKTSGVSF